MPCLHLDRWPGYISSSGGISSSALRRDPALGRWREVDGCWLPFAAIWPPIEDCDFWRRPGEETPALPLVRSAEVPGRFCAVDLLCLRAMGWTFLSTEEISVRVRPRRL